MTAVELISSGMLESYCLGFAGKEENALVEEMAAQFPEVQAELNKIGESLATHFLKNNIQPSRGVKNKVMFTIYSQQAESDLSWVPLMHTAVDFSRFQKTADANFLSYPSEKFENLHIEPLPSTEEVSNFAVWAKHGHEEELHTDRHEYMALLSGSCDMFIGGKKSSFVKGDIIVIEAGVSHYGVVTSTEPMFALVQRQLV